MSEETTNLLEDLVQNEYVYRISSLIISLILIGFVLALWCYIAYKDNQTKKLREKWLLTLTDEQRKAIFEENKLKIK